MLFVASFLMGGGLLHAEVLYSANFLDQSGAGGSYSSGVTVTLAEQEWLASYCYFGNNEFRLGHNKTGGTVDAKFLADEPQGASLEMMWDLANVSSFSITTTKKYGTPSDWYIFESVDKGVTWVQVKTSAYSENFTLTYTADEPKASARYAVVVSGSSSPRIVLTEVKIESSVATAVATPVASVKGGTYTETQSVTLSCATDGATIYYTLDGSEPTAESTKYESAITIDKTTTLKAIAIKDDETSDVLTEEYAIVEAYEFTQITTLDELTDGTYILVGETSDKAMSSEMGGDFFNDGNVTIDNNAAIVIDLKQVWNITKNGDSYTIEQGGQYVASNGNENQAAFVSEVSDIAKFNVTVENGVFTFACVDPQDRFLQHNSSNNRFACYKESSKQQNIRLFKGGEVEQPAVAAPVASVKGGFYTEAQSVKLTCATENAVIYYTLDGTEPDATKTQYAETAIAIDKTTTLKAIAILDGESSSVLTVTYTFPEKVDNIAAFMAKDVAEKVYYQITGTVTVTAQSGSYLYVTDASGNLLIYGKTGEYSNGQTFTGLVGAVGEFGGAKQMSPYTPMPEAGEGTAVEPTVMTPDEISADDLYAYIKIEGAEIASAWDGKDAEIKTTDGTLALRDQFGIGGTIIKGSKYDIIAIVGVYNDAVQVQPLSMTLTQGVEAEQFSSIAALIEAAPAKAELTCDLTVLYHNGKNLYVRDAAGDNLLIYDSKSKFGDVQYENGQTLSGGIVGAYTLHNGVTPELETLEETEMPVAQAGTAVEPDVVNPADLTADDVNRFVSLVNVEIAETFTFDGDKNLNASIVMGDGTFTIRDSFRNFTGQTVNVGDRVDIVGFVDIFDNAAQVYPISIKSHGETTDINAADLTGVTVCSAEGGTLYIVAEAGQSIQIWSVTGQLLYSDVARADLTAVSSMPRGVVIVRVGNETVKAIVR